MQGLPLEIGVLESSQRRKWTNNDHFLLLKEKNTFLNKSTVIILNAHLANLADKYDVSIDESKERADIRCENSIAELLRNDITGYNTVVERGRKIGLKRGEVKYALLPVWILNTRWNNTNYMFVVNGQTGKIVGDLPVDKKKLNLIRTGVFAGVTILSGLVGIGGMIASLFT